MCQVMFKILLFASQGYVENSGAVYKLLILRKSYSPLNWTELRAYSDKMFSCLSGSQK